MDRKPVRVLFTGNDDEYAQRVEAGLRSARDADFQYTRLNNSSAAFDRLAGGDAFDILLMECASPADDGPELKRRLTGRNLHLPVVLITNEKDLRRGVEAIKSGVEEYLFKGDPVETILPRTILSVIDRASLRRRVDEAEREALLSEKKAEALQELIVTMCHEFNNPLAAIKISSDILARQIRDEKVGTLLADLNSDISRLEAEILRLRDSGK